jgi:TolB protein
MSARHVLRTAITLLILAVGVSACSGGGSNDPDPDPPPEEDTTPPAAPSGIEATSNDGSIDLSWNSVSASDLDGYNVYRDTQSFTSIGGRTPVNGSLLSSPNLTDSDVDNGTTYYYRVTALDTNDNESGLSGEATATPFPAPPDRP